MQAVIDVGSNSVRLLICEDNKAVLRQKSTSRLGEGMAVSGKIDNARLKATCEALFAFVSLALLNGVDSKQIYVFATGAVRNASNGNEFVEMCAREDIVVKVLTEKEECEYALLGALKGDDGAVIDIGGASSELAVATVGKIDYYHSSKTGAVIMHDLYGDNRELLEKYTDEIITEYGRFSARRLYAVGGTATSVAHMLIGGDYDRERVNGSLVTLSELSSLIDRLFTMTSTQRYEHFPIGERRAQIICGGALLLYKVAKHLSLDGFYVSEDDNLEGFLYKINGYGYK